MDETTAGAILSGLAYLVPQPSATTAPSSARLSPALSAKLAKAKAKAKAASAKPAGSPEPSPGLAAVQALAAELLEIAEPRLGLMGGHALQQLAAAAAALGAGAGPELAAAFRRAVAAALPRCRTYAELAALCRAAAGGGGSGGAAAALALPAQVRTALTGLRCLSRAQALTSNH